MIFANHWLDFRMSPILEWARFENWTDFEIDRIWEWCEFEIGFWKKPARLCNDRNSYTVSDDSEVINLMKSYYGQINKRDGFWNWQDFQIGRILEWARFENWTDFEIDRIWEWCEFEIGFWKKTARLCNDRNSYTVSDDSEVINLMKGAAINRAMLFRQKFCAQNFCLKISL